MTTKIFNRDNAEGYTDSDLAELNALAGIALRANGLPETLEEAIDDSPNAADAWKRVVEDVEQIYATRAAV